MKVVGKVTIDGEVVLEKEVEVSKEGEFAKPGKSLLDEARKENPGRSLFDAQISFGGVSDSSP